MLTQANVAYDCLYPLYRYECGISLLQVMYKLFEPCMLGKSVLHVLDFIGKAQFEKVYRIIKN